MDLILKFIGENNQLNLNRKFIYSLEIYPFPVGKAVLRELEKMTNMVLDDISLGVVIHPDSIPVHERSEVPKPLYFEIYFQPYHWSSDDINVLNIKTITVDRFLDLVSANKRINKILEQKVRHVL
tara:strand:- start:13824 stop:14198 length:375 start_codon:yes stop_codon:yes gene_type:complete